MNNLLESGVYTAWLIGVCSRMWSKKWNLVTGMQSCMDEIELGELIYLVLDVEGNEHFIRSAPFSLDQVGPRHQLCKFKHEMGEPYDPASTVPLLNQIIGLLNDSSMTLKKTSKFRLQVGNSFGKYNLIYEHLSRSKVSNIKPYNKLMARIELDNGYPIKRINLF